MRRAVLRHGSSVTCWKRSQSTTTTTILHPRLAFPPVKGHLQRYNALISRSANQGNLVKVLQLAKELKQQLSASDEGPDHTTYEALARAFAVHGFHREAFRVVGDAKAAGVEPDIGIWNQVLRAHIVADQPLSAVVTAMEAANVAPNALTNDLMIQYYTNKRSVEPAIRTLVLAATKPVADPSSSRQGLSDTSLDFSRVSKESLDSVFNLVCDVGESRLAIDLLKVCQRNGIASTPSESALYNMVAAGVTYDDANCVWLAIESLEQKGYILSEGLAVSVLQHLSRHGLVDACEQVFTRHLRVQDISLQEWHLAPMVTACTSAGRLDVALGYFEQLCALPSHSAQYYKPSHQAFLSGLRHLSALQQTAEQLQISIETDSARIPIQLINAMLVAYRIHRSPKDGKALAEKVFDSSGTYPAADLTTFEIMLQYCSDTLDASSSNAPAEEASRLLSLMRSDRRRLKPSRKIYETLMRIHLHGGEDELLKGFDYLEEMKHFNHLPSSQIYIAILQRLLGDSVGGEAEDERIDLLLQEMASLGYLGSERDAVRSKLPQTLYDRLGQARINDVRQRLYVT